MVDHLYKGEMISLELQKRNCWDILGKLEQKNQPWIIKGSTYTINHDYIHGSTFCQGIDNTQQILSRIWLRNKEIFYIYPYCFCKRGVHSIFDIQICTITYQYKRNSMRGNKFENYRGRKYWNGYKDFTLTILDIIISCLNIEMFPSKR